jgi:hypothetical protein
MTVLAAIAIGGFILAMALNWRLVKAVGQERRDAFRRGYYGGFVDSQLGRKRDWITRHAEELERENL